MVVKAERARSGWRSIRCSAVFAWTLMTEMLCATTSCRSRAILIRSSLARRRSSSSRLRCSATARWLLMRISSAALSRNTNPAASPSANAAEGWPLWPISHGQTDAA